MGREEFTDCVAYDGMENAEWRVEEGACWLWEKKDEDSKLTILMATSPGLGVAEEEEEEGEGEGVYEGVREGVCEGV
jgi:hypothetical protein